MSRLASGVLTLALGLAAFGASGAAEENGMTAKLHPWGRFEPGTWKTVRVVTETFNEQGEVVSVSTTETKTILQDIDRDGVTLDVEACMEVAGKRFQVEPQTVKQGFHGEPIEPKPEIKESADAPLTIEDRKIACKVQRLTSVGDKGKTTVVLHYSTTVPPYLFKRECVVTSPDGKSTLSETNTEVIALDMPVPVQGEIRSGIYVKTVHKNSKTTLTTLAMIVPEVPGGVVRHSSKEVDKSGRLVRRSTLELVDYNADPDKDRTGLFGRKRPNRRTKQSTRYGQ